MGESTGVPPQGIQLLIDLVEAADVAELRRRHCRHCQHIEKDNVARRACLATQCRLLDSEQFDLEQRFLLACDPVLFAPDLAHLDDMEAFNWYLHRVGCVTPAILSGPQGFWQRGVRGDATLRGLIHVVLYEFMVQQVGELVPANVQMTQRELIEVWSKQRAIRDRAESAHAAWMKQQRYTLAEICAQLGRKGKPRDPDTVRRMIRRRSPRST